MNLIRFVEIPLIWAQHDFTLRLKEGKPIQLLFQATAIQSDQSSFWNQKLLSSLLERSEFLPEGGSEFQQQVWREISLISWGELRTYSDIAEAIGRPQSVRAVANACGRNPLPLLIPCHRVVGKSDWGGYNGGIALKKKLLKIEGHLL